MDTDYLESFDAFSAPAEECAHYTPALKYNSYYQRSSLYAIASRTACISVVTTFRAGLDEAKLH